MNDFVGVVLVVTLVLKKIYIYILFELGIVKTWESDYVIEFGDFELLLTEIRAVLLVIVIVFSLKI